MLIKASYRACKSRWCQRGELELGAVVIVSKRSALLDIMLPSKKGYSQKYFQPYFPVLSWNLLSSLPSLGWCLSLRWRLFRLKMHIDSAHVKFFGLRDGIIVCQGPFCYVAFQLFSKWITIYSRTPPERQYYYVAKLSPPIGCSSAISKYSQILFSNSWENVAFSYRQVRLSWLQFSLKPQYQAWILMSHPLI
jgi:hypothetical protein